MRLFHIALFIFLSVVSVKAQNFVDFPYSNGVISMGGTSTTFAVITTDRSRFQIDKQLMVRTGKIGSHGASQDLILTTHLTTRATIRSSNGSFGLNVTAPLGMMHVRNTTASLPGLLVDQTMANTTGMQINMNNAASRAFVVRSGDSTHFQVMSNGLVFAREIEVKLGAFPDYVFGKGYRLLTLPELKSFIGQHSRLPNMPSAQQVAEQGIGLGELARLQTEKIEELTLHIIALHERIEALENQNQALQALQAQINALSEQLKVQPSAQK